MLLYDGECRLCRFAARCVVRLDRRHEVAFLPLQDDAASRLLAVLAENERLDTWRIAQPNGSLTGRGAGVPDLLDAMWLTRLGGRLLELVPDSALEAMYQAIARNRGSLGRFVPNGPAPRRFP